MGYKRTYHKHYYGYRNEKRSEEYPSPHFEHVPPKPIKPDLSSYPISKELYDEYEHNPEKVKRHRERYLGCLPLAIVEFLVFFCYYHFFIVRETSKVPGFVYLVAGLLVYIVWGIVNARLDKISDKAYFYERYKRDLQEYEQSLKDYNAVVEKNQKHQRIIQTFISGERGEALLQSVASSLSEVGVFKYRSRQEWMALSAREFELEVGDVYRRLGYSVTVTKQSSDGGVDIILSKGEQQTFVQCKHYSESTLVGVRDVREFYGVCMQYDAKGEFVFTSSLTKEAQKFCEDNKVSRGLKMVSLDTLIRYDMKGASLLDEDACYTLEFKNKVHINPLFIHCRYFWIYKQLFPDFESAQRALSQLTVFEGKQYAIFTCRAEEIDETFYVITIGGQEAIRQLKSNRKLYYIYPEFSQ